MRALQLKNYRCTCGKLLFRGTLFFSAVEIKCKRCRSISVFDDSDYDGQASFVLFADNHGIIVDECKIAEAIGLEREYCIGKHVTELYPFLRDSLFFMSEPSAEKNPYQIPRHTLMLQGGRESNVQSIVVPLGPKSHVPNGYQVFNMFLV